MADGNGGDGLRERLAKTGEDALGKLAQDLLENPLINGAIARAFEAREKAAQAQEVAFGALNLPSAADIERLTRRVRSLSQRLEGIEDGVDRLDERLAGLQDEIAALRKALPKPPSGRSRAAAKPAAAAAATAEASDAAAEASEAAEG
jgi:predicted  nucleic acid-binding Zn-ribbon protein